jgi:8-oxo-dGTP pyrophosphatase MutT (NUDIX family)
MAAADELVDECDETGRVVGTTTRADIRARRLWHRTVFIAVVTTDARVWVHRRADWKDVWPGWWDVCFGGVLGAGEAFEEGAVRELAEEAGITEVPLARLGGGTFTDETGREVAEVYLARTDEPCTAPDGEVTEARLVALVDLPGFLAGHPVVPDSTSLVVPHLLALRPC